MEEPERVNKKKEILDKWFDGAKDDVVLVEQAAWTFLPAAKNVVITNNEMIYMN